MSFATVANAPPSHEELRSHDSAEENVDDRRAQRPNDERDTVEAGGWVAWG